MRIAVDIEEPVLNELVKLMGEKKSPAVQKAIVMPLVLTVRGIAYDQRPALWHWLLGPVESPMERALEISWCVGESDCP